MAEETALEFDDTSVLLLREDIGETYNAVARSAAAAVGAEACDLALYDAETGELIARRASYQAPREAVPHYRFLPTPPSARVLETGLPYLCNDTARDELYERSAHERGIRSVLTVPVRRGAQILGLLYARNKPGGFSEDDARTLTALAGAAAVTLENLKLYGLERDRRVLNESLREVSRAIVTTSSEDAALASVLDQMWRVVRYQGAAALVLEGDRLRVAASRGGEVGVELPVGEAGDLGTVLERREAGALRDASERLAALGFRDLRGRALAAPLRAKGDVLGAFVVVFEPSQPPTAADEHLVAAFADHAALFLEVGTVLRRERQARTRAAAVARVTRLAVTRHDPESLLQAAAPEFLALAGADRAVLYLRHPKNPVLISAAEAGTLPEEEERVRTLRLDLSAGPLASFLTLPHPVAFEDAPPGALTPHPGTRSLLVLPLVCRDQLVGAALLSCVGRTRSFEPAAVELLSDVAQQIALGVENARLFAQLSQLASTDELTQLANRRRFTEALRLELARHRRTGDPVALVMADVDHLKKINDTWGHPAGDAAIRHVADAFKRGRRETDVAARLGGEEFALILPGADRVGAVQVAERIRRELSGSRVEPVGTVTVSIGVAIVPDDAADEQALVRAADERLYSAKSAGRNQVCYLSDVAKTD